MTPENSLPARRLKIRHGPSGSTDELVSKLTGGDAWLSQRLCGNFRSEADLARVVSAVSTARYDREALTDELTRFNRACENSEAALARIADLRDPSTLLVVTGQQPGFFGGPLLCALKAATAIATARELTSKLQRRVHPLFWIASDDHDLDEVRGTVVLDSDSEYRKIRVELEPRGRPIADVSIDAATATAFMEALRFSGLDEMIASPSPSALAFTPRPGENWSLWFARTLARLFARSGLILFEPASAPSLARPFLEAQLADPLAAPRALHAGARDLEAHGIAPPLPFEIPSCSFITIEKKRQRFDPNQGHTRDSFDVTSRSPLSADAALRTVLQSRILPAIAVIGGPGELKYWLQLRELFAHHATTMPIFFPRISATFVTPQVRRAMDQLNVADQAFLGEDELLSLVRSRVPPASKETWQELATQALSSFDRFATKIRELGGSLPARIDQSTAALKSSIERIIELAGKRQQEVEGVSEKKVRSIARSMRPMNKPQDRVFSSLPFALRFGDDLFDSIAEALDPFDPTARIVDLGLSDGSVLP